MLQDINDEHEATIMHDKEIVQSAKELLTQYRSDQPVTSFIRSRNNASGDMLQNIENALNAVESNMNRFEELTLSANEETKTALNSLKEVQEAIDAMDKVEEENHERERSHRRSRGVFSEHDERALTRSFMQRKIDRWEETEAKVRVQVQQDQAREKEVLQKRTEIMG